MSSNRHENPANPDQALASYLDELLSVPDNEPAYLDDAEESSGASADSHGRPAGENTPGQEETPPRAARQPKARRPQQSAGKASVREAEKSPQRLISPAFRDIPVAPEPDNAPTVDEAPSVAPERAAEPDTAQAHSMPATQAPMEPMEMETPPAAEPPPSEAEVAAQGGESPPQPESWLQGRPVWAQEGFECLIFRVAGLQLAVPLVLLGQVHRMDCDLTPLVGRPDWFLGLLTVGRNNIRVVDTARWVMPERYREGVRENYQFVIQLGDSSWGLACDQVAQSFRVQPDEVKWRSERSRRQWLAGTIKKEMCALLDVSRLAQLLAEAESGRHMDLDS